MFCVPNSRYLRIIKHLFLSSKFCVPNSINTVISQIDKRRVATDKRLTSYVDIKQRAIDIQGDRKIDVQKKKIDISCRSIRINPIVPRFCTVFELFMILGFFFRILDLTNLRLFRVFFLFCVFFLFQKITSSWGSKKLCEQLSSQSDLFSWYSLLRQFFLSKQVRTIISFTTIYRVRVNNELINTKTNLNFVPTDKKTNKHDIENQS